MKKINFVVISTNLRKGFEKLQDGKKEPLDSEDFIVLLKEFG